MITRRQFFKLAAGTSAALALTGKVSINGNGVWLDTPVAEAFYQTSGLTKWATQLRGADVIPVAVSDGKRTWPGIIADHYTIDINQFTDQLHPLLGNTTLRGFNPRNPGGVPVQKHLGGIIIAQRDKPIQITFRNNLPTKPIMPIDLTIMGANQVSNRTAVHFHGGLVPWISDGGPFAWWNPQGKHGPSFIQNSVLNPRARNEEAEYYYPMNQSARFGWYHDHAVGITRLNAYYGIASAIIIRDAFEASLIPLGLPAFIENGGNELPIVIQDKIFVNRGTIGVQDPTWPGPKTTGSLWYPHVYDTSRWEREDSSLKLPDPSVVPEMFGDTMLANGTVYPQATVQARRYRLRILNACQARFLNLQLYEDTGDGITRDGDGNPTNAPGPDWLVIGAEGGFLATPALVPSGTPFSLLGSDFSTMQASLLTGPAERWDVIVDFAGRAGSKFILYNDAPAPFPTGDQLNDYFSASDPGPDTRQIMRFEVVPATASDPPLQIGPGYDLSGGIDPLLGGLQWTTQPQQAPPGINIRQLTLNESFDSYGRLIQLLGTTDPFEDGGLGRPYDSTATEVVSNNTVEVWQIINTTGDTHPMHFHLSNVHLLSRRPFNVDEYEGGPPAYIGAARGPNATELGWKETVKMHPGEVTTFIARWSLPQVPFTVPASPRTGGNEYVWHCHILDHEEHDMMRPLIVTT